MTEDKANLIEQCQLSSLYHEHRECFLSSWHRVILFVIIMSSALLGSNIFESHETLEQFLIILPIILASLDLVFNLSTSAQTHKFFRHRFTYIESNLVGDNVNLKTITQMDKEITLLMAEEPPAYRALLYHCTNLVDLRKTEQQTLRIPWIHMRLRNFFRFAGSQPVRIKNNDNKDTPSPLTNQAAGG